MTDERDVTDVVDAIRDEEMVTGEPFDFGPKHIEILDARVVDGRLRIRVEEYPEHSFYEDNMQVKDVSVVEGLTSRGARLHWAQQAQGFVYFYLTHPNAPEVTREQDMRGIHGPRYRWSSRPGIMNQHFPFTVEAVMFRDERSFNLGGGVIVHLTGAALAEALELAGVEMKFKVDYHDEMVGYFDR